MGTTLGLIQEEEVWFIKLKADNGLLYLINDKLNDIFQSFDLFHDKILNLLLSFNDPEKDTHQVWNLGCMVYVL